MNKFRSLVVTLIGLLILSSAAFITPVEAASKLYCFLYNVNLTGTVDGNDVDLSGYFILYTDAKANTLGFLLQSGKPVSDPMQGSITFASNAAFLGYSEESLATFEKKYDSKNRDYYWTADVDPFATKYVNVFNAYDGGSIYSPYSYSDKTFLLFVLSDDSDSITGAFNLYGDNGTYKVAYTALFKGDFVRSYTDSNCALPDPR